MLPNPALLKSFFCSARQASEKPSGEYTVIFPTRLNIEMLAESDSVENAIAMANEREIVSVLPWIEDRDGDKYLCIPANSGYSLSEEKM